ncbi:MAG: dynamin family protein [Pirellulales bacterium]
MTVAEIPTKPRPDAKKELLAIAKKHLAIVVDPQVQVDRERRLQPLCMALSDGLFRVVVMGEIKKGKSSFINALLGRPGMLPTDVDVATAAVFKIVYGPEPRATVFYKPDECEVDSGRIDSRTQAIDLEDLWIFGTESGAEKVASYLCDGRKILAETGDLEAVCAKFEIDVRTWKRWNDLLGDLTPETARRRITEQVDFIAIELPSTVLVDGLTIVDTPGLGGLFKRHRDVTFRFAPQADVVVFVLDSAEAPISADEFEFLRELRNNTQRILFLQTKIDVADREQVRSWRERNLDELSAQLGIPRNEIPYFLVGANKKLLAEKRNDSEMLRKSGYPDVLNYVGDTLIPERDRIVARKWIPTLESELANSFKLLNDRLNIARTAHLPEIAKYEQGLAEAEREFERWRGEIYPRQQREFQDQIARLKRDTQNRLQDFLSSDSPECREDLESLRNRCGSADMVNAGGEDFLGTWAATWNKGANDLLSAFQREYTAMFVRHLGAMAEALQAIDVPRIEVDPATLREYQTDQQMLLRRRIHELQHVQSDRRTCDEHAGSRRREGRLGGDDSRADRPDRRDRGRYRRGRRQHLVYVTRHLEESRSPTRRGSRRHRTISGQNRQSRGQGGDPRIPRYFGGSGLRCTNAKR